MTNRVLKAYIKDKYGYKVGVTKGLTQKYYLMERDEVLFGYNTVGNILFNSLADVIDYLEG